MTGIVIAKRRLTRRGRVEQVDVRVVEALFLASGPDEGPDHADAGEGFAHDLVDSIELDLHRPEQRDRAAHDDRDERGHERQHDDEKAGQRHVLADRQDDPADDQDRRRDHEGQGHEDDRLNLLNVVRVPGDERRGPELVDLDLAEALDPSEDRAADVAAEAHRDLGAEEHADDRGDADDEGDEEHEHAGRADVARVALRDAVVDDVALEGREVEVADRLDEEQRQDDGDCPPVWAEVGAEERDHGLGASVAGLESVAPRSPTTAARAARSAR